MATKRTNSRGASRQQESKSSATTSGARMYGLGLLSGLFVAFLAYLVFLPAEQPPSDGSLVDSEITQSGSVRTPEYEFFEVLPNQRIEVNVDPQELRGAGARSIEKLLLLQAGSFRDREDADRRRAELLLLGLEPAIEQSDGETGRWYRVLIGPFASRSAMARARGLTAQQDIDTLLVERDRRPG
ncbi:MAG: SPOR domain-containing protein [Pseudomonadota bacterium]